MHTPAQTQPRLDSWLIPAVSGKPRLRINVADATTSADADDVLALDEGLSDGDEDNQPSEALAPIAATQPSGPSQRNPAPAAKRTKVVKF